MTTFRRILLCGLVLAASLHTVQAQFGFASEPTNIPLQSWSFNDPTNWTDDSGDATISFTNLSYSTLGDGQSLVVQTNVPAWLNYEIYQTNADWTNLVANGPGSLVFWYGPGWTTTNGGPGKWAELIDVGQWTSNSSVGYFGLAIDPAGSNLWFEAQDGAGSSYHLGAPISWTTNYFHCLAITYSSTNVSMFIDGQLATNDAGGLSVWPGSNAISGGVFFGSDRNGNSLANGLFDLVTTYNYPLNSNDVQTIFNYDYQNNYEIDPVDAEYMDADILNPFSLSTTTNLAISPPIISSNLASLFVVNSTADVTYEVQGCTNLSQGNWFTEGFALGSELTNWTWASFPFSRNGDLFLRIRNWQDTTGTGIPDWWWVQYFGQATNVNPYADPTGDGWTVLQDFENGWNPNVFRTPPAPKGLTAIYNSSTGTATVSWLPSPSPVTGYTVEDSNGNTFNVSASTNSIVDNISSETPDPWNDGNLDTTVQVEAHYGTNTSPWSSSVSVEMNTIIGSIVAGPLGTAYLAVSALPPNTSSIRLTVIDDYTLYFIDPSDAITTNFDIPISDFTNGLCPLPNNLVPSDGYYRQIWKYNWYGQAVGTNGAGLTSTTWLTQDYNSPQDDYMNSWLVPPYFDGRVQLKQNLIFQLRAAVADRPFQYTELIGEGSTGGPFFTSPTNYAYAGYYYFDPVYSPGYEPDFDTFLPFEENYFDRNFVFNSSYLDSNGRTTTGVGGQYYEGGGGLTIAATNDDGDHLELPVAFEFVAPTTNGASISSVLATNETRWLSTYALDSDEYYLTPEIGVTNWFDEDYNEFYAILPHAANYFGLPFLSDEIAWGNSGGDMDTLYTNSYVEDEDGYFYPQTAQPQFHIVGYDWWIAPNPYYDVFTNGTDYPGMGGLSINYTNPVLITSVGNASFQIAGFAKLAVTNSYESGVYGFLQQYFANAFEIGTNGSVTTNATGLLSPYGSFFATQPGPVALVTMPDPDTGQQGTGIVNCISLNVDRNHDGNMDLTFAGPDATSQSSPMVAWVNNGHIVPGGLFDPLDHDVEVDNDNLPNYSYGQINCPRDLENFFRLWVCGIPVLTNGYQATLSWANVSSGNPGINLYDSVETNGGTGYLTDTNIAAAQCIAYAHGSSPYSVYFTGPSVAIAQITHGSSFTFPASYFTNSGNQYFLFEGAGIGEGELTLKITDSNSNTVAQSGVWLDLHDVKDLFEQAHTDNVETGPPNTNTSVLVEDQLLTPNPAENQQLVMFVHGLNVPNWEYMDESETMFRRLYWQGFGGRFATFDWPSPIFALIPTGSNDISYFGFNTGEYVSWHSGAALNSYIGNLRSRLPGYSINVAAHSLGNIAANEAIREGAQVDNYALMQAAVSAGAFDGNNTNLIYDYLATTASSSPNANALGGYNNCFTNTARRVNFYNDDDFALYAAVVGPATIHTWEGNQLDYRPDDFTYATGTTYDYSFDGTNCFFAEYVEGVNVEYRMLTEDFEKKSYVARSRTKAVGAAGLKYEPFALTGGVISTNISLQNASLGFVGGAQFGATRPDHSGEFTKTIQNAIPFYYQLMRSGFQLQPELSP